MIKLGDPHADGAGMRQNRSRGLVGVVAAFRAGGVFGEHLGVADHRDMLVVRAEPDTVVF